MTVDECIVARVPDKLSLLVDVRMICLPPAGSSAGIYFPWRKVAPEGLKIQPIEYSGHGTKVKEPLIDDPAILAGRIAQEVRKYGDLPIILFGHSLGAALLWRVLQELEADENPVNIILVVVSGRPMREFIRGPKNRHLLGQDEFIREIKKYNNFPEELLANEGVLQFFLKIFRNDFLLNEKMLNDFPWVTDKPLLAFYGKDDHEIISLESMEAWASLSDDWLGCYGIDGDHFYFNNPDSLQEMLQIIASHSGKLFGGVRVDGC